MGLFDKIRSSLSTGKLKKEQIERLRESIWAAVSDGEITDREIEYIDSFYKESELSPEDFDKLRAEIFIQVVQQAIADRRVVENELKTINHLVDRLQISADVKSWAEKQMQYYALFSHIESGAPLPVGPASGLILQKNEVAHVSLPAQLIEERVMSRNYQGGSRGVSLRVVKGVSFRVGQQKGQMVSESGLVPISDGYFVVTSKRLVFSGDRKTVTTKIDQLLDLHVFADGLNYSASNRQKPVIVRFSAPEEAELCALVISRLINE